MCNHLCISTQIGRAGICKGGHFASVCGLEIVPHLAVIRENGASSPHFRAHIANSGFPSAGESGCPLAEIFYYGIGTTLHCQHTGQFEDYVLCRVPSPQSTDEPYPNDFRNFKLPLHTRHHVHSVGTAHSNGQHSETACIGGVRVCSDHHSARKGIILQHNLMNDSGPRFPETDTITGRSRLQKIIDFPIRRLSCRQVLLHPVAGTDQMVTMYCGRHGNGIPSRIHKLEQSHLGRGILHRNPVRPEKSIVFQTLQWPQLPIVVQMGIQYLFRESHRPSEHSP